MRNSTEDLERWLRAGGRRVGQVLVSPLDDGWELRHADDAGRDGLDTFAAWEDARALANLDDRGSYRPLKTAPNLRRGWRLVLRDAESVRLALDYFHPAMLGVWLAHRCGELKPVDLRETLARQTGMYRITQKLTDEQARRLVGQQCRCDTGCIKIILWKISPGNQVTTLPAGKFQPDATPLEAMPLLCHEACNILVAAARKVVKEEGAPPK
jgi:sirohydrochlorin cobaltochelatase